MQLECYSCGYVGTIEDFTNQEPQDLVDIFENAQTKKSLQCPDCEERDYGPLDE